MSRVLQPGPRSLDGLEWIARVGATPLEAWQVALGWSRRAAYSHAARLIDAGLIRRDRMTHGQGSLLAVTRTGAALAASRSSTANLGAVPPTSPTSWAHFVAAAWVAAWFTARGRTWIGEREMRRAGGWSRTVVVPRPAGAPRKTHHRPDLGTWSGDVPLAVEVELNPKSTDRWRAILGMYAERSRPDLGGGPPELGGVVYVVRSVAVGQKVQRIADELRMGSAFALRDLDVIIDEAKAIRA